MVSSSCAEKNTLLSRVGLINVLEDTTVSDKKNPRQLASELSADKEKANEFDFFSEYSILGHEL